jgi:diguanylate cyclase (GGDEF)-like protein
VFTLTAYILATVAVALGIAAAILAMRLQRALEEKRRLKIYALKLRNAERSLKQHAFFDPLTGLANRLLLVDRFQLAMQHAKRSRMQFAVLMIDLNKFKAINDTYGHAAGDTVLVTVAQRLISVVRASDTVARLGGDEFVLIIESISEREQIASLGQKLIDLLADEITLDTGHVVSVGGSIGIAWYPKDGENLKDILDVADQAMYFCKTSGIMPFA